MSTKNYSRFLLGLVIRMEGAEVRTLFDDLIANNPDFARYFPESCLKRSPPKRYFWLVYSVLYQNQFNRIMMQALDKAKGGLNFEDLIQLTPEAKQIFDSIDNSNSLTYYSRLISV